MLPLPFDSVVTCVTAFFADHQQAESQHQQAEEQQDSESSDQERQWWHSTFVKAGRMGNMASDVLQSGQPRQVSS